MIITDKDEYMHIVNEQKFLFALFHIPTVAIHIYFENCSPKDKLKIFFNTREDAESVLKEIDARMEHPLINDENCRKFLAISETIEELKKNTDPFSPDYFKPILGGLAPKAE